MKSFHKQLYEITQEPGYAPHLQAGIQLTHEEVIGLLAEYQELKKKLKKEGL